MPDLRLNCCTFIRETGLSLRNPGDISWRVDYRERVREAECVRATQWRELSPTTQLHRLDGESFDVVVAALPPSAAKRRTRRRKSGVCSDVDRS
jgi:hypothetical protein